MGSIILNGRCLVNCSRDNSWRTGDIELTAGYIEELPLKAETYLYQEIYDTIVQRRIGTGCWRPPDPLVRECDPTLRMYKNQISRYQVSGNSLSWLDGMILGCEFPVRNTSHLAPSYTEMTLRNR